MKNLKYIFFTYLILTVYDVFSQSTGFKQFVRLETGLGLNFCKNKIDEHFVFGYPKVEAIPLVRPGYNFYSNASMSLV